MFVAASTQCFHEMSLNEACDRIVELGFDKVELWFDREGNHLNAKEVANDPDRFAAQYREITRLSPIALAGDLTEDPHTAVELCRAVKGLGLTLDPSYYICGPNGGRDWDVVFPYVYHCHLRDTTPEEVQVPVGLGEVDYSKIVTRMEREKADPALSIELLAGKTDSETRPLEMRKLRRLLESLL